LAFGDFRFHFDDKGRFVLLAPYAGVMGDLALREDLNPPKPVTALDLSGSHRLATHRLTVAEGPVTTVLWGQHHGFTRLSVNYDPARPPQKATPEVLCRPKDGGGLFAVRLTFGATKNATVALALGS
jgi:hypothetical protein